MINFPYFLYRILLSESNYAILYDKSTERGFLSLFANKCKLCVINKKWDKKRRENAKKLGERKIRREKQGKNQTPEKWGGE